MSTPAIDSPEVIERARANMAKQVAKIDQLYTAYVAEMRAQGYAEALMIERLISQEVFLQLAEEMEQAVRAKRAEA